MCLNIFSIEGFDGKASKVKILIFEFEYLNIFTEEEMQ